MCRCVWILCLLVAVVACGSDDDEEPKKAEKAKPPTSTILFVADPKTPLRYTRKTYRTKAGRVELAAREPVHGGAQRRRGAE